MRSKKTVKKDYEDVSNTIDDLRELEAEVKRLRKALREVEEISTNPIMNDLEVGFIHRPFTDTEIIERAKDSFQLIKAIAHTTLTGSK